MIDSEVLTVAMHIQAEPSTVFPYFTDPARYVQCTGTGATLETVPGGVYRVRMREGVEVGGQSIEVDPPWRIVFTWGWVFNEAVLPALRP